MFATYGNDAKTMPNNIMALGDDKNKCKIIVDDAEFYDESPFQDEEVSQAINDVTGKGILYITSAGNRGNTKSCTSMAWEGYFKAGTILADGRTMHVFSEEQNDQHNEVLCSRDTRGTVHARVFWNDPPSRNNRQSADLSGYGLSAVDAKGNPKVPDTVAHHKRPYSDIHFPAPDGKDSNRIWIAITKAKGKADRFLHLDINVRD